MRRDSGLFVAAWASWLSILAGLAWITVDRHLPAALLSYAALGWVAIAATVLIAGEQRGPRILLDSSLATVATAFGLTVTLTGFVFGLWLVLIGAEITLLGVVGARREQRRRVEGDE